LSTGFVGLCIADSTVPAIAMLSVRNTEMITQKALPEFVKCSCSVPLVLPKTVLFVKIGKNPCKRCKFKYSLLSTPYSVSSEGSNSNTANVGMQ
jgi:hypothetical protein